jgi:hypothetical protein
MTESNCSITGADRTAGRIPTMVLYAIEVVALLVVLLAAWKARSVWPSLPLSDGDTWGYLSPALTWLSGEGFRQADGRDWLYPAMVALFLKSTGNFAGILSWQRVLGLGSAILMAATWRCFVALLPVGRWGRFLISLAGALPIYVQLTNEQNILYESSIRPEAVLPFFVYAQLGCVVLYCRYRWQKPRALPALLVGAASVLLAYACLVLKPSWYFAFGTTSLPVFFGLFGKGLPMRTRWLTPVLGGLAALGLVWLPGKVLLIRDGASRTLLPDALFCVHAQLIERLFTERCARLADADPEKARLQALLKVMDSEMQVAANVPNVYEKLRIDPDYLMHSPVFSQAIYDYAGDDRGKFSAFCFASYAGAVLHYPWAYTQKVCTQFAYFLFPDPRSFVRDHLNIGKYYREGSEFLQVEWGDGLRTDWRDRYRSYHGATVDLAHSAGSLGNTPKLREIRDSYAEYAFATEILFLLALLVAWRWPPLRDMRPGGWAAGFLFLAPFGNALGVCIVHALDIYRYRATLGGYLLFALTAMAAYVVAIVACGLQHYWASRRRA